MLYIFGDYELDTQLYELRHTGKHLKIEPQVFNALAYLITHYDRTVTKQELIEYLWPEQFVSEAALSYCIMTARKAVGDSGRTQRVIKTLHGRGFRFIAALKAHGHVAPVAETSVVAEIPLSATPQELHHQETLSMPLLRPETPPALSGDLTAGQTSVTVLCATLLNPATPAEQLGFDALQRVRQAFFALAQDEAKRHEGTLQFFGADGMLVLFGVTAACADHARRAVLGAMGLQRRLRARRVDLGTEQTIDGAVRMGLHTGPLATESMLDDQRLAAPVMGETTQRAIWLQYLAEPGTLRISEATMRLVQDAVQCVVREDVHIPGQSRPIAAYTVRAPGP